MLTLLCWVYPKITQFCSPEVEITTSNKLPKQYTSFSIEKDNILVSAWLNTSIDVVHGNELKQEKSCEKF